MNSPENFANGTVLQITMREMQRTATSSKFWIGLICVVAVLTVSGPFRTSEDLTLLQRLTYWGGIAVTTYFLALLCMVPVILLTTLKGWHWTIRCVAAGIAAGIPIGILIYVLNTYIVKIDEGGWHDVIRLQIVCIVIAIAVAFLRHIIVEGLVQPQGFATSAGEPKFMRRLSHENRGEILSLNSQDHYVEAVTSTGKELILMRLGDAIDELPDIDGRRIHRSWWVAKAAIKGLAPYRGQLFLDLLDGRTVPVSRSNEKMVMDWLR